MFMLLDLSVDLFFCVFFTIVVFSICCVFRNTGSFLLYKLLLDIEPLK